MKNRLNVYIIAALFLLTGCQKDISGTYLASDNSTVIWLQLVRTPDNHLTGQLAISALKPDGSIERNSVPVTGAVDGENVSLSVSRFLGLQTVTFSGTLDGNKLTLTGGEPAPFALKRSTLPEYQAQVAKLDDRSKDILTAKTVAQNLQRTAQQQRNFVIEIDQLIGNMQRFDSEADLHLGRFPNVEKGYQAITAKMTAYVERERQLASNPNASIARSQLSIDANQTSFATDQLHNQGESLQSALETNITPMANEVTTLEQKCHETVSRNSYVITSEIGVHNAACDRLTNAASPFRKKYDAIVSGLRHLEQVYQRELNTQKGLLQEAQKLE